VAQAGSLLRGEEEKSMKDCNIHFVVTASKKMGLHVCMTVLICAFFPIYIIH